MVPERLASPERSLGRALIALLVAAAGLYFALVVSFFPTAQGRMGHDYEYFLPLLLAGKYWIVENGFFAVPRFSPAFCGGLPFLANPQSIFYSVPQLLSLAIDPIRSFFATTVIFAGIGAGGTYALMARRFGVSAAAAALSAVIFLFNGFLMYRMAIGHVTYHVVGLVPLLCYLSLTPVVPGGSWLVRLRQVAGPVAGVAAILAYFVYAGAPNALVPLGMTCLMVWLLHALIRGPAQSIWAIGGAAALIGAATSAAKLAPALAFLHQFPRPDGLHLFDDASAFIIALFEGLFLPSFLPDQVEFVGRHELEFGVGLAPFMLIIMGMRVVADRIGLRPLLRRIGLRQGIELAALGLLIAVPFWLNYGGPAKAAWLKSLPYIGDNVVLVRWFYVYLLPLSVGAGLLLDFVFPTARERLRAAMIGIVLTVAPVLLADRAYYGNQPYDPATILAADRDLGRTGTVPPITGIDPDQAGQRDDGIAAGDSAYPCYEPIFGYALENFPPGFKEGRLGTDDRHLRNPACYIYGADNACVPGAVFTPAQRPEEAAFAHYRRFSYALPAWQRWADRISLLGLAMILIGFAVPFRAMRLPRR